MKIQIEKFSPEWNSVHYRTQLVLGLPAALPLKIYKFTNSDQELQQMKQFYINKTIIDGHLNQSAFDQASQRKILQKKYKMSNLVFQTGHIAIPIENNYNKRLSLWLLKAAVGDSYCVQISDKSELLPNIPEQYDSIYLCQNNNQDIYKHNYILRQHSQYTIQYQVLYTPDKSREYNVRQITCNKCQKKSATGYCKQQQAFFCSQCFTVHHRDKLLSSHIKQQLTKFNSTSMCKQQNHNKRLQLYCIDCQKMLCIQCSMNGWHSNREYQTHQVKTLKKYYQQKYIQNQDLSKSKRLELQQTIGKLQRMMNDIDGHAINLQRKIRDIYEAIIKDLKENTKNKLDKILVVKTQIKRLYDQLIWTDSFIKYQQQLLKPVFYLEAQKEYQIFREKLVKAEVRNIPKINVNDIDVIGELRLIEINQNKYQSNMADKKFKQKSQSRESRISSNSKLYGTKNTLNNVLNPPADNNLSAFKTHHLEIKKEKSVSHFNESFSQGKSMNTKPILQTSLRNAGLTSIKFS